MLTPSPRKWLPYGDNRNLDIVVTQPSEVLRPAEVWRSTPPAVAHRLGHSLTR